MMQPVNNDAVCEHQVVVIIKQLTTNRHLNVLTDIRCFIYLVSHYNTVGGFAKDILRENDQNKETEARIS